MNKGEFEIFNEYFFKNLSDVEMVITAFDQGKKVGVYRNTSLRISPQQRKIWQWDQWEKVKRKGVQWLNFDVVSAGNVIAQEQVVVQFPMAFQATQMKVDHLSEQELSKDRLKLSLNEKGQIASITFDGKALLAQPLTFNFWRRTIDNDYGYQLDQHSKIWKDLQNNLVLTQQIQLENGWRLSWHADGVCQIDQSIILVGDQQIKISTQFLPLQKDLPLMPRFGLKTAINKDFSKVKYIGRGPYENYIDRNSGAFLGHYEQSVAEFYVPYVRPQEYGHRTV
ncbi:hypothetical protein PEDI_50240 [Persicobacter diffluens]|uniref:beta-galactosidase n=1 Tax=Persicobacter diffluens TaxID=981 RepID=A0AAN4W541_9BACT|nr:hypothetical protein PEDI_50240 [Persicobacter diffluens]